MQLTNELWKKIILSLEPLTERIVMAETSTTPLYPSNKNDIDDDAIYLKIEGSDLATYLVTVKYKDILERKLYDELKKHYILT